MAGLAFLPPILALLPLRAKVAMLQSTSDAIVIIDGVNDASLPDVASCFAEAYFCAGTTQKATRSVDGRERRQLVKQIASDFRKRYGAGWQEGTSQLFSSRLLYARDSESGQAVGCVGVEAALYDAFGGRVYTSRDAEAMVRRELDLMSPDERDHVADVHRSGGVTALAAELYPQFTPLGLLSNLAVAPSRRRSGLGRELCEWCEGGCAEWRLPGVLLLVEEENAAGRAFYSRLGYEALRQSESTAVRLNAGGQTLASGLLLGDSATLLEEVPTTIVTMAKQLT